MALLKLGSGLDPKISQDSGEDQAYATSAHCSQLAQELEVMLEEEVG